MSRNSSLESQAFVKRASTGNRLYLRLTLFIVTKLVIETVHFDDINSRGVLPYIKLTDIALKWGQDKVSRTAHPLYDFPEIPPPPLREETGLATGSPVNNLKTYVHN